ncbi:bifunctional diguanylate cyclase/phosphodiesterase [Undibacterium sp. Dicai25W]|uniref:bifunctional diguanylate cyclase/phosphodiesterase n=1 Tax=Undibacterium sp. Dicai25W TaxID=3413034 RepID=UPI003BF18594
MNRLLRKIRFSVSVSASALIALVVGLALTAIIFTSEREVESGRQKVQFQQSAKLRILAIKTGLQDSAEQLVVLNQLFSSFGVISRQQFHTFTAPILQRYPQIQALSFQRLVTQADRHNFEVEVGKRYPNFTITEVVDGKQQPAAIRDRYNVVEYIEPAIGNEAAMGVDTSYNDDQAPARKISRETGRPTSTGLLSLAQDKGWHTGFLILAPVYWQGAPLDNAAMRVRAAIGETAAVFRTDHFIGSMLHAHGFNDEPGMDISLYASSNNEIKNLASRHTFPLEAGSDMKLASGWLFYDNMEPLHETFTLAGSSWHLEATQAPVLFTVHNRGALYVLIGGLLSSLLVSAYVFSLVSRIAKIERETKERTASLQFANLRLSEDVASRVRTEKSLRLRERVIEVSANAVIICSAQAPDYPIEYVNPAFERITGFRADEVVGHSLESLQGSSQDQQNMREIREALREKREGRALLRNYRKDGTDYWNELFIAPVLDEQAQLSHFVVAQYDISAVMGYEAEMEFQANHDVLTGLANRNLLRERLGEAILSADRSGNSLWVVFLDLDRFKFVNDTLGHEAGDVLLKVLAGRLQSATHEADTVARLGGDEFVLILPDQVDDGSGQQVLQRIMDSVAQPLTLQNHEFYLTCSMGVARYPHDGNTAESLIKLADIAMYRAKEMGRSTSQFYTSDMIERTLDRLSIEADLRQALDRNEFQIHYQPQICTTHGHIVGMEVLLRWQHPVHGMIQPGRFIGLAEEMGLIIPIGAWVIREACMQTKAWQLAGFTNLRVAVNLSPRQFTQKALAQSIADILQETELEPRFLELELTESMVMKDVDSAISILGKLKELGIHIAIDDFGTGYSSLSYLRRFPIDVLKIDQSFVNELTVNADAANIVVAIISLAHSLRLRVIAEGVETLEQLTYLRDRGCDEVQGYYFSRPVPANAFESLLRQEALLKNDAPH